MIVGCCTSSEQSTRDQLRALLRETAQPVAVVTSAMPALAGTASKDPHPLYHGATLSSFTSIALDPYPLVTFALRLPSRMATSLKSTRPHIVSSSSPPHMVINILSATQASVAITFSRPDLHREPFSSVPYFLSKDGLPILEGSLGAISCKLVSRSLPLHDLDFLEKGTMERPLDGQSKASELFIAQVIRVEDLTWKDDQDDNHLRTLPLLYHRRGFTSCDIPFHSNLNT